MKPLLAFFALAFVLSACQKTVHLNLGTTSPQLVITGAVTDQPGPYTVTMSTSEDFYSNNPYPSVSGAQVIIADTYLRQADTLTETSPGTYQTHTLTGVSGHNYALLVNYNGKSYTAQSTMPAPVELQDISFYSQSFGKNTDIQPIPNFQDPPGIGNDYQFVLYVNGKQLPKTFVFSDRLSDGRFIHETLNTDTSDLKPFDQLRIDMYCIDPNVYNYFYEVTQITDPGQQAGNAAPGNPTSNIYGGALGIFSAHTVSSSQTDVPKM
ncbi:MAG TPA: DUF4249 family protein [Dinghuibacter sp.]|uniref:DUF4249 family protein n=1 Tax=Dinghuibacter sp. TaxID=2024697 RepID=UPI002B552D03|nr:DUF4249 family protein [Dinghuibacter sp.]HTJ11398.1 DUF4249 family protein [Dinghuibacter sp.]